MASFTTHISKESNKRKRSPSLDIEDEETVSTALCQFSSKQDVRPDYLESSRHIALMAGDGHTGDETAKCLSKHSQDILKEMLEYGIEAAMSLCQDLCKDFKDGAMLVLCLYEFSTREVQILSVGDASCSIYQNGKIVHQQPHQDAEWFYEKYGDSFVPGINLNGEEYGQIRLETDVFGNIKKNGTLKPQIDGNTMLYPKLPSYMEFFVNGVKLENIYASGAFIGHKNYPRLPPLMTEFLVAPGPFHIVMTSDGVSDVMHPEDPLIRRHDVTAIQIMDECKKRWTSKWLLNGRRMKLLNTPTIIKSQGRTVKKAERNARGNYRVTFKDGEQRIVPEIDETNVGADDISVLVYTVDEEEPPEPMKCSACGEHIGLAQHICTAESFIFITDLEQASKDIQAIAKSLNHFATREGVCLNDDRQDIIDFALPMELEQDSAIINATYIFQAQLLCEDDFLNALHEKGYESEQIHDNVFRIYV